MRENRTGDCLTQKLILSLQLVVKRPTDGWQLESAPVTEVTYCDLQRHDLFHAGLHQCYKCPRPRPGEIVILDEKRLNHGHSRGPPSAGRCSDRHSRGATRARTPPILLT